MLSYRTHKYKGINNVFNSLRVEKLIKIQGCKHLPLSSVLRILAIILTSIIGATSCFAQSNLDFEKWDVNYNGIDQAKNWINTSDATQYNAPTTLFKIVDNPGSGLASLKLTTAYWPEGSAYNLDTLVGALLQQVEYSETPKSFEFLYKCSPAFGDEILIGIQLTKNINNATIVVGEGFFTSNEIKENWTNQNVSIEYYTNDIPDNINLIALSSANAVTSKGRNGYAKIGSTLFLDELKLRTSESEELSQEHFIHVFPNPAKSFINVTTNSPESQQIEIYNLSSKLLMTSSFINESKIDISKLSSGTYVYKVFGVKTGKITSTNKFNVIR